MEAALALDHAHENGVLHRDIKPSNLMIDGAGHLWVADFGLARFQSDSSLTVSGDVLGTLRYMSPEQALANRSVVDQRTDVYSLGATLYELITLHPPFEGSNRQDLLRKIAQDEPRRPRGSENGYPSRPRNDCLEGHRQGAFEPLCERGRNGRGSETVPRRPADSRPAATCARARDPSGSQAHGDRAWPSCPSCC